METMYLDELEEIIKDSFDFDVYDYFYHMTFRSNAENMMEEGLGLEEKRLSSTTILITKDDIDSLSKLINSGDGHAGFRQTMVLIACEKELTSSLVLNAYDSFLKKGLKFYIPCEFIMGYIDLEEEVFYSNQNTYYPIKNIVRF